MNYRVGSIVLGPLLQSFLELPRAWEVLGNPLSRKKVLDLIGWQNRL